jgi:hypothetical protein
MKKIQNIIILIAFGFLILNSCSEALDDIRPRNQIAQDQLGESDLGKVVNGVYAAMEEFVGDGNIYFDGDKRGENLDGGPGFALTDPMMMAPASAEVLSAWRKAFSTLKQVNFLIETYESANNSTTQIAGATGYYFRALIYYNLAIRWGKAPILRKRTNDVVPLSPESEVWSFIVEDLKKAEQLLPEFTDKFYVSQSANNALSAKVYLSLGENTKAAEYAQKVIDKTNFELAATSIEYASAFVYNTQSKEIVFALANKRTSSAILFYQYVNDTDPTWNYAPISDCYDNLYADQAGKSGDIRKSAVFSSTDNKRIIKFANGQPTGQFIVNENPVQSPIVVCRIAEMHLILAEAQGNTSDGQQALKTFMNKRYQTVDNISSTISDRDFQNIILDERHREFYGEGFRWYDLKRTNRLDLFESLNGRNYLMYYPVPQNEIDLAGKENYPQNGGYE